MKTIIFTLLLTFTAASAGTNEYIKRNTNSTQIITISDRAYLNDQFISIYNYDNSKLANKYDIQTQANSKAITSIIHYRLVSIDNTNNVLHLERLYIKYLDNKDYTQLVNISVSVEPHYFLTKINLSLADNTLLANVDTYISNYFDFITIDYAGKLPIYIPNF